MGLGGVKIASGEVQVDTVKAANMLKARSAKASGSGRSEKEVPRSEIRAAVFLFEAGNWPCVSKVRGQGPGEGRGAGVSG